MFIFKIIHDYGPISRTEIVERSGLAASTVSVITAELQERNYIRECGHAASRGGRRPVLLELNPDGGCFLTADLSSEELCVAAVNLRFQVVKHFSHLKTPHKGDDRYVQLVSAYNDLREWCDENGLPVLGVGVAVPGLIDASGRVVQADSEGWYNFDLKSRLETDLQMPVNVQNDTNAAAYGEFQYGLERTLDYRSMMFVSADRGIGSGLILNRELYIGVSGMAGEIGQMSQLSGDAHEASEEPSNLESLASNLALLDRYRNMTGENASDIAELVERSEDDESARSVIRYAATMIGTAIANQVNMLNVDTVVLGGMLPLGSSIFMDTLVQTVTTQVLRALSDPLTIRRATLGVHAGLIGVASLTLPVLFSPDSKLG